MGTSVDANGRSILHKGHGQTHTCAVPDVCKTPSPGGPVPIPYVNIAMDSNISDAAESVKIEGNPVANLSAKIATSTGDEPGSAGGGILSSKIKGTVTWQMGSLDVKAEGKSVVRFLDNAFHNGNSFNTSFIDMGGTGMGYADDFDEPCPICGNGPPEHAIPSIIASSARVCADLIQRLRNADPATVGRPLRNDEGNVIGYGGYMVGVMVCKDAIKPAPTEPNTFATMSGYTLDGFANVASGTPGVHSVLRGGAARPADLVNANTSNAATTLEKATAVFDRFNAVTRNRQAALRVQSQGGRRNPYSVYGTCAGAKLLAKSGHAPIAMTEMFFQPRNLPPWTSPPYTWRVRLAGRLVFMVRRVFTSDDQAVTSCDTCQETLFMTMCPQRVCTGRATPSA
jgi:hypothetical protein